jgi:hypothetical protein
MKWREKLKNLKIEQSFTMVKRVKAGIFSGSDSESDWRILMELFDMNKYSEIKFERAANEIRKSSEIISMSIWD